MTLYMICLKEKEENMFNNYFKELQEIIKPIEGHSKMLQSLQNLEPYKNTLMSCQSQVGLFSEIPKIKPSRIQLSAMKIQDENFKQLYEIQKSLPIGSEFQGLVQSLKSNKISIDNTLYLQSQQLSQTIAPLFKLVEKFNLHFYQNFINHSIAQETIMSLEAQTILAKNEVIIWWSLDRKTLQYILSIEEGNQKNMINNIILDIFENSSSQLLETIKNGILTHPILKDCQTLCIQIIENFNLKNYNISIYPLFSILDRLLTQISELNNTNMKNRTNEIIEKLNNLNISTLADKDYHLIFLIKTFDKVITTISKSINFSEKEPESLNRHWILHGRSNRIISRLDCIKLLNIVYSLTIIYDFCNS